MARCGPPSTVTPEQRSQLLALLMIGSAKADCYQVLGISRSAVVRACKADTEFKRQVEIACLRGKAALLRRINTSDDWRASAWMLERRWPAEFGKRSPDQYSREQVLFLVVALSNLSHSMLPADRHEEFDKGAGKNKVVNFSSEA